MSTGITPYQLADGVYFRLGKKLSKKELGIALTSCKSILEGLRAKNWEDYEILQFADSICYEMKQNQMPLVFRMFCAIALSYINCNVYQQEETKVQSKYSDWIQKEILRLQNS